jgi:cell division protein FtsN
MSKDYRQTAPKAKSGGGLLLGVFIGFLLGVGLAAGIAIYFFKTPVPFLNKAKPPEKTAPVVPGMTEGSKFGKADETKPRFDFYRILPGQEEPVTEQQLKQAEQAAAKAGTPTHELYFLQAGAFQNPADADNLKASLALLGLEASVEPTNLPDKGIWYRVRLGPYANVDAIDRARAQLAQNGVDASLVRIRDPSKN